MKPLILDGGVSSELERRGYDLSSNLWSARLLRDSPDAVVAVHRAFFQAGADIATSATYQAHEYGFRSHGMTSQEARALITSGVRLARRAAETEELTQGRPLRVAASLGPYGAALADGSEYTGRYRAEPVDLKVFHRTRLQDLLEAHPDYLAIETMPRLDEALIILELLQQHPKAKAWVSFTLDGQGKLPDGTSLHRVSERIFPNDQVLAVGVNCVPPESVQPALTRLNSGSQDGQGVPLIAYPNRGETYDPVSRTWKPNLPQLVPGGCACSAVSSDAQSNPSVGLDPSLALTWINQGAMIVGGCCRTTPQDISELSKAVGRLSR